MEFKSFIKKNFFKIFIFFKKIKFSLFTEDINNSSFSITDLIIIDKKLKLNKKKQIIFDIGSHYGNEVLNFDHHFPLSQIYSFEANPTCFEALKNRTKHKKNVFINNIFLSKDSIDVPIDFFTHEKTDLVGSYYPETQMTKNCDIKIKINTDTIDNFCKKSALDSIDILRVDVNGYELETLKGATKMLDEKKINYICSSFFDIESDDEFNIGGLIEISKFLDLKEYRFISAYNNFFHQKFKGGYYYAIFAKNTL